MVCKMCFLNDSNDHDNVNHNIIKKFWIRGAIKDHSNLMPILVLIKMIIDWISTLYQMTTLWQKEKRSQDTRDHCIILVSPMVLMK